ncbi:MAG: hypothetical protein U0T69_11370 [Chitinophagales bacterium]
MNENKIKNLTELLTKYGKVEKCEVLNESELHVKITDGFSTKIVSTLELMKLINDESNNEFPIVKKCVTDNNLFDYVLTKNSKKK